MSEVCFKGTFSVNIGYDLEAVKKEILKLQITYVPVIDPNKRIVEFLIWDKLFDAKIVRKTKESLDIPVVIMAGGKGTRLDPFTRILPKSVIQCEPNKKSIVEAVEKGLDKEFRKSCKESNNIYGNGNSAKKIKKVLMTANLSQLIKKYFYDLKEN